MLISPNLLQFFSFYPISFFEPQCLEDNYFAFISEFQIKRKEFSVHLYSQLIALIKNIQKLNETIAEMNECFINLFFDEKNDCDESHFKLNDLHKFTLF